MFSELIKCVNSLNENKLKYFKWQKFIEEMQ